MCACNKANNCKNRNSEIKPADVVGGLKLGTSRRRIVVAIYVRETRRLAKECVSGRQVQLWIVFSRVPKRIGRAVYQMGAGQGDVIRWPPEARQDKEFEW